MFEILNKNEIYFMEDSMNTRFLFAKKPIKKFIQRFKLRHKETRVFFDRIELWFKNEKIHELRDDICLTIWLDDFEADIPPEKVIEDIVNRRSRELEEAIFWERLNEFQLTHPD